MSTKYVAAGAGSGKTYRLTHDLAEMLTRKVDPVKPSRIILTTFTKSAAADFLRKARAVLIAEKQPVLAAELDSALIGTVHSVCEKFVKKYWYRLGLTLPLNILSSEDKKLYVSRTAEGVARDGEVKFFAQFAEHFEMNADFWKELLSKIVEFKYSFGLDSFTESCEASCEAIAKLMTADATGAEALLDDFLGRIVSTITDLNATQKAKGKKESMQTELKEARQLLVGKSLFKKAAVVYKRAVDGAAKSKGYWKDNFDAATFSVAEDAATRVLLSAEIGDQWQACVRKLFELAVRWEDEYRAFKDENRLLDFDDLEQKFIRMLYEAGFEDVRQDIRRSYDVLMVDEFQDSNPVQLKIFRKLMELVEESVFVGDQKQAIYGFRGTESTLVEDFVAGMPKASLKKSHRSRVALVDAASDVFCRAFGVQRLEVFPDDPTKPYDGISLKAVRPEEPEGMPPALQHWNTPPKSERSSRRTYSVMAEKIREIVASGKWMAYQEDKTFAPIRYRDVAVLLRNGTYVDEVVQAFRSAGVPVSIQEKAILGWAEVQLMLSLVRYVFDEGDACARAEILHLMGGMTSAQIIRDRVAGSTEKAAESLFERLKAIRGRISNLSIPEIVESLALELDLYGNVAGWGLSETRTRNIGFMVNLARQYAQQCESMNAAPTLPGYVAYVSSYKPEGHPVDRTDTVKVLTVHSAKGLEWSMVVLDELDSLDTSEQETFKKEFSGVHPFRRAEGGDVLLRVFPTILSKTSSRGGFDTKSNLPAPLMALLTDTEFFKYVSDRKVAEERRLLYVAFTRAKDYLVTLGTVNSNFSWPVLCHVGEPLMAGEENALVWHPSHPSTYVDLQPLPAGSAGDDGAEEPDLPAWKIPVQKELAGKYRSPSEVDHQKAVPVVLSEEFRGVRMEQDISEGNSAICGTCIHRIFAAFDPAGDREEMVARAARIIDGMGLAKEFPSPSSVVDSAAQFIRWLTATYGPGTPLHELPFVKREPDGVIVRGEMDLVWELPDGECVLVDYKSYHEIEDFDDPKAWHKYYGYAPQLKDYKDTLEAGGYRVRDVLIYYFVQGRVVKFDFQSSSS